MVKKRLVLMLLCTLIVCARPLYGKNQTNVNNNIENSAKENNLQVSISKTEKQWGEFFRATLIYQGKRRLNAIDLKPWLGFVSITVDDEYSEEENNGVSKQFLKLRLHPRMTGRIILPTLGIDNTVSQPIGISVTQPVVNKSNIDLDWDVSKLEPWQREAVVVRVRVTTDAYDALVKLDLPDSKQFLSRVLKTESVQLENGRYRHNGGWVIYPIKQDDLVLDLPPVRYLVAGSDRRRFYLPLQTLQVKALPNYIPPTLAIGKLNIDSKIVTSDIKRVKQWQLTIETDGLIPYGIPELDMQLAKMTGGSVSNISTEHSQLTEYDSFGDVTVYSIPLPNWLMPFGQSLKLEARYFDTELGVLKSIKHTLQRTWLMPTWAWWVLLACCFFVVGVIIRKEKAWFRLQVNRFFLRRYLRETDNVEQMRKNILASGGYVSLSDWADENDIKKSIVRELNDCCFSGSKQIDNEKIEIFRNKLLMCV